MTDLTNEKYNFSIILCAMCCLPQFLRNQKWPLVWRCWIFGGKSFELRIKLIGRLITFRFGGKSFELRIKLIGRIITFR